VSEIVLVTDLGRDGEGVARSRSGLVLFIPGATLGDRVRVTVPAGRRSMARVAGEVAEPSPRRQTPPCPYYGTCGGCSLQELPYEDELAWKRRRVAEALARIGRLSAPVAEVVPAPDPYGYRHKAAMPVSGRPPHLGFYARGSHRVVAGPDCLVAAPALREALIASEEVLRAGPPLPGLVEVVARLSSARQEILLTLVVAEDEEVPQTLVTALMTGVPGLASLWLSVKERPGNRVLGERFRHLAGRRGIEEELLSATFLLTPADFFQVHPWMAERLFGTLLETVPSVGRAADLYAGVGVGAILLARRIGEVVGVELVREAVRDARRNALRNRVANVSFRQGRVEEVLPELPNLDLVLLDPPRKGAPGLAPLVAERGVREVRYISCDPGTLARDAAEFQAFGYTLEAVLPFDMFPRTTHVESLALFSRS
jgi:23S rRNA (uracil1939-C5)-methyltransferase